MKIVATGAKPLIPKITGISNKNVITAHEVLAVKTEIKGQRVAVLGQYSTGAEIADFLAEKDNVVPVRELAEQLQGEIPEVYTIGDAAEPRNIAAAIYEGALVARRI